MNFLSFLNHWWNAPFLLLLGLVGVFFALQLIGLAAFAGGDAEADIDVDADADLDHEHDVDGDHDGDGLWAGAFAFLGIGRVPFMVVWTTFFICAGFAGLFVNRVVSADGRYPMWALPLAILLALVGGVVGARVFARLAARFVDVGGRGAARKHELAGKVGVVASLTIDARFGEVRVRDDHGNEHLIHGRMASGEPRLGRGAKVVLIDFDEEAELFWVAAVPELDRSA